MFKLLVVVVGVFCVAATAAPEYIQNYISNPRLVGEGRFSYMFWDIYDGKLFAPGGIYTEDAPAALTLYYLREFDAEEIVNRTIKAMKGLGNTDTERLREWENQISAIFPSVEEGDAISAIRDEKQRTYFFLNSRPIGTVPSAEFTGSFLLSG